MPWEVFISYASEDKPTADAACAVLEKAGLRCWIAPRDVAPGADWGSAVVEGLEKCRVVVLIFSSHANRSRHIRRELERAVSFGATIIPLRIEDVDPTMAVSYFVSSVHWMDALTPPLEAHLENLAASIGRLLELPPRQFMPGTNSFGEVETRRKGNKQPTGILGRRNIAIAAAVVLAVTASFAVFAYRALTLPGESQPFDAMAIPFISQERRQSTQQFYPAAPGFKAVALAFDGLGIAAGASSEEAARQQALEDCRSSARRPCLVYAVGAQVVWPKKTLPPLPLSVDISGVASIERLDVNKLPSFARGNLADLASSYSPSEDQWKTLAVGTGGPVTWTIGSSNLKDSIRRTLEKCSYFTSTQCLLMAVGNYLTQPLPTLRKLKDVFLFSNDTQIPSADRDRLEKVYLGDNWRAIAKGEHGTWEAVAGKPSEAEAIGSVLELCARSGDTCRVFAIGNFLVEGQ